MFFWYFWVRREYNCVFCITCTLVMTNGGGYKRQNKTGLFPMHAFSYTTQGNIHFQWKVRLTFLSWIFKIFRHLVCDLTFIVLIFIEALLSSMQWRWIQPFLAFLSAIPKKACSCWSQWNLSSRSGVIYGWILYRLCHLPLFYGSNNLFSAYIEKWT